MQNVGKIILTVILVFATAFTIFVGFGITYISFSLGGAPAGLIILGLVVFTATTLIINIFQVWGKLKSRKIKLILYIPISLIVIVFAVLFLLNAMG